MDTLGAVNKPVAEIVPALVDQVTAVFELPLMLAENCCCPWDDTVTLPGEIETIGVVEPLAAAATTIARARTRSR